VNFLAHLWLTDRAGLPLVGAVLGDVVRGRLDGRLPPALEASIRFHRQVDVATDSHPISVAARARFPNGARRWAGIVLDLVHDHVLALNWSTYSNEPLEVFAQRAAVAVADQGAWQLAAGRPAPDAARFEALLLSYREAAGIDHALGLVASRLSRPELLIEHSARWRGHLPAVRQDGPGLLAHLGKADGHP
jgi:acyl carrier protein phosphodiesterase